MSSTFSWKNLPRPIIILSPMADMTDSAFCRVVKEISSPVVFREMVSAEAVVRDNEKTLAMGKINEIERPIVEQIFGSQPKVMAEAARKIVALHNPDGIDINMGCPVYKLVHHFNGAALMKEPTLATEIIKEIKKAVAVPVSVKIRLGWNDPAECLFFSQILEDAGADLITIHGRTKTQGYSGKADWEMIRRVKENLTIPVLVNGDIFSAELARQALEQTGCAGVAIGRGALGNPWIFQQIEQTLAGKTSTKISLCERISAVKHHVELHCGQHGERSIFTFRKHLVWYFKGLPGAKILRQHLPLIDSKEKLFILLDELQAMA